jgi:tetratricopeptide (TPR) repeat protein
VFKNLVNTLLKRRPAEETPRNSPQQRTPEQLLSDEKRAKRVQKLEELQRGMERSIEKADFHAAAKYGLAYAKVASKAPLKVRRATCSLLKRAQSWSGILLYFERIDTEQRNDNQILVHAAIAYRELHRYDESAAVLEQALLNQDTVQLRRLLADVLAKLGRYEDAAAHINHALLIDPDNVSLNALLIRILVAGKMFDEAEKRLSQAVVSEPNSAKAHAELGDYYRRMKRKEDACAAFYQASLLAPDNEQYTLFFLRAALACAGDNYISDAIACGERLLENQSSGKIMALMAQLYTRLPATEQAIAGLDKLLQKKTDDEFIVFGLAQSYFRAGNLADSRKILETYLARKPGNKATVYRLAGVMAQQSEPAAAIAMMMHQISETDRDAVFCRRVGHILAWMGMTLEAMTWLRKAIELDRTQGSVIADLALCYEHQQEFSIALSLMEHASDLMAVTPPNLITGLDEMYQKRLRRRMIFASHVAGDSARSRALLLEARRRDPIVLPYPFREWTGGSLANKRVAALTESGIGDEIRFTCIFHRLLKPASEVLVSCDPRLETLLKRSFPDFRIFPTQREFTRLKKERVDKRTLAVSTRMRSLATDAIIEAGQEADIWVRLIHLFEYDSFDQHNYQSPEHPVLTPDPKLKARFGRKIRKQANGRPVIGISWRGGHRGYSRDPHYFRLEQWKPILDNENFCFVNLQYAFAEEEIAYLRYVLGERFIEFPEIDLQDDLDAVAALCSALDATVAICTSVLELSASVGTHTLYLMRSPQVTHAIRLNGDADLHGSYQDDVWRNCRIIPRFSMGDEEMVAAACAHLQDYMLSERYLNRSKSPR